VLRLHVLCYYERYRDTLYRIISPIGVALKYTWESLKSYLNKCGQCKYICTRCSRVAKTLSRRSQHIGFLILDSAHCIVNTVALTAKKIADGASFVAEMDSNGTSSGVHPVYLRKFVSMYPGVAMLTSEARL
jgi:hypothetical protein